MLRTPVGDKYVLEEMLKTGATLGGEQSGHILFRDGEATTGDGLLTALRAMDIMVRDMLQVGQGLPSGRTIDIPNGTNATLVKMPGAPGTSRTLPAGDTAITAIVPGPGLGPTQVRTTLRSPCGTRQEFRTCGSTASAGSSPIR